MKLLWAALAVLAGAHAAVARVQPDAMPQGRVLLSSTRALLGEKDHKYKQGEDVPLWASKVGPFANPR